jgi:replicative DNA helicase
MSRREPDPDIKSLHGLMGGQQQREPPNNIEVEQALLGAILINNEAYGRVSRFLEPKHFYEPLHRRIYMLAGELIEMGRVANHITLKTYLPSSEKVGDMTVAHYLARLASEAVTIINSRDYGLTIHELWSRRELIPEAELHLAMLYDAPPSVDPIGNITPYEEKLAQVRAERILDENRVGHGRQYMNRLLEQQQLQAVAGVPIFMPGLSRIICEPTFAVGNLYGICAASGEGKTSFMLQQVLHALKQGHPVQIQSFDQTADQFVQQMIAQQYAIENRRQAMLQFTPKEAATMVDFSQWLDQQPFEVLACASETAPRLVARAREFVRKKGTGKTPLIVTDHIQAVTPDEPKGGARFAKSDNEGVKVKQINQIIKTGAGTVGAAWIMLNQRNTPGTARPNPRPIPSDVYGGQAALYSYDTMIYLYRFKKYLEERRKVMVPGSKDSADIEKVFPSDVRQGADIIEIGSLKVRFGDNYQEAERLDFEARFTRIKLATEFDQEELAIFAQMGA